MTKIKSRLKNEKISQFKLFDGLRFTTNYERIDNVMESGED